MKSRGREKEHSSRTQNQIAAIAVLTMLICGCAYAQVQLPSPATVAQLNNQIYVDGTHYAVTQAGVQQAFTDACAGTLGGAQAGATVYLPPMHVVLNNTAGQQFLITCPLKIVGAGPTQTWFIVGTSAPNSIPIFRVMPSVPFIGWFEFADFRITTQSGQGGDAIYLDNSTAGVNHLIVHNTDIFHLAPTSWAINMSEGTVNGFFLGDIYDNAFSHGINMNSASTADSWLIYHNTFNSASGGVTPCINATTESGSAHITAFNNNGGCAGGFFISHGTTECKVLYNQIEQPAASTEANSSVIDLMGDAYNINGCEIRGNNINQHNFADVGIRLGNASNTTIEGNVISVRPATGSGIVITSGAHDTVIPFNEYIGLGTGAVAIRNPGQMSAYAVRGPDGKAQTPTFSFLNHPGTGWYSTGTVLQSAVNGADSLGVSQNGLAIGNHQVMGWSGTTDAATGSTATGLSSCGSGCVAVGDGSPQNAQGQVRAGSAVFGTATVNGNLVVHGTILKSAGGFKIDHPLDPTHKWLAHSFVESPDMKNIYDGVAILNERGEAEITLPDYFQALNKDFRYQLTCIGGSAPVYIAREIKDNRFLIAGGKFGLKVSWQVTGTRNDSYAQTHRIAVEEPKPAQAGKNPSAEQQH